MDQREPDAVLEEETSNSLLVNTRCCFCFPNCFGPRRSSPIGLVWWERIRTSQVYQDDRHWWTRAFMRIRGWSELVAGPKWKTFIRRFNRNRSGNRHGKFQYDPMSYALNFDNQINDFEPEDDYASLRNFSTRYASVSGPDKNPLTAGSVDRDVEVLA
ncbi:hypothetical protein HS088_TW15G00235 [Tripterygium wilfordii]|uniref:NHL domain-containing protein n=1 Tax=Tripterygium wilfordii TaxID=458696 RepID=A0A7J7CKZ9_TRIWF|nr:uncharacterized protein LOC120015871 [Tripterygium wilfordii]KAF5734743.1 hypothetical protein HS088_TW15G00235 [Tripterygium wilfordii]